MYIIYKIKVIDFEIYISGLNIGGKYGVIVEFWMYYWNIFREDGMYYIYKFGF